jgi:hypothetical protein
MVMATGASTDARRRRSRHHTAHDLGFRQPGADIQTRKFAGEARGSDAMPSELLESL